MTVIKECPAKLVKLALPVITDLPATLAKPVIREPRVKPVIRVLLVNMDPKGRKE
jgi:hypothetical protein